MRRLHEAGDGSDADEARLGQLFRSVGPLPPSDLRKRRVFAAVQARAGSHRAGRPVLRPAFAAGLLLLVGGIAGATVGRAAWERVVHSIARAHDAGSPSSGSPAPSLRATPATRPAPVAPALSLGPAPSLPTVLASPQAPEAPQAIEQRPARSTKSSEALEAREHARPSRGARAVGPAAPASAPTDEEAAAALFSAGYQAHLAHQPERARVLFEDYLEHNPNGALAEDALAYDVEAAARQSDPEAVALARSYLLKYPTGRYAEFARSAIAHFASPAKP